MPSALLTLHKTARFAAHRINAANYTGKVLIAQTVIHIAFLFSAMAIAYTDRRISHPPTARH